MFKIIDLPYAADALEPVISAKTLSFHHGKHLQAYVDNLNKLLPGSGFEGMTLEEIVVSSAVMPGSTGHPAIFNNAGQILNHNLYFTQFRPSVIPDQIGDPVTPDLIGGPLLTQIETQWGSFDAFKADFEAKGTGLFGSGWVWLAGAPNGTLTITQEPGAGNPLTSGLTPILTFDVWEHAYYLDYQNRRASHLSALWQILNWAEIKHRYQG
ncbi:MAG: superoxide dismutase [Bacteroidales bacterium]|nr:superoxide dismutase [Bacteroidales bacterium]